MTTRAQLRTTLRTNLEDTSPSNPLWTDAQLDVCLRSAMRAYGDLTPLELSAALSVTAGTRQYTLPAAVLDPRDVARILDDEGREIPHESAVAVAYQRQSWRAWSDQIVFSQAPAAAAAWSVMYRSPRLLIEDDVTAQPIAEDDESILLKFAAADALELRAIAEAKRGADRNAATLRDLAASIRSQANMTGADRSRAVRGGYLE